MPYTSIHEMQRQFVQKSLSSMQKLLPVQNITKSHQQNTVQNELLNTLSIASESPQVFFKLRVLSSRKLVEVAIDGKAVS